MTPLTAPRTSPAATGGVAALGPDATALLRLLDQGFESWGTQAGALPMITPPLLPVARLAELDYYQNFPHQAVVTAPLRLVDAKDSYAPSDGVFAPDELEPARLALPSAACYGVYLHLADQELATPQRITVLGRCFRREEHYEDLRRLLGFHMREIVAIGTQEYAEEHLRHFTARIEAFADRMGLPLRREAATDPFYDRGGPRALLQQISPVKHEFLHEDLAIASVNTHRNFFGERCSITLAGTAQPVFTSCVAFGLERWLAVLTRHFGGWAQATEAVERALESC
ncbi:aminoacyl--tRNA ligase-related protein [Streptomyces sp. NPDC005407]|uniref:aminoacyl--tRNA ligase-related protein n=1 Tax=Streptomyces sp. NPDC005407 TaxID=3155340 RepID=UPI0033A11EAE